MARMHILTDDGSPITIGDSTTIRAGKGALSRFLAGNPKYISFSHPCFREMFGGLGVQNTTTKAITVEVPGQQPVQLSAPWTLILNGEVQLVSADNLTIRIVFFGDFDLFGKDQPIKLLIGSKDLSSAVLLSKAGVTQFKGVAGQGLILRFDQKSAKIGKAPRKRRP